MSITYTPVAGNNTARCAGEHIFDPAHPQKVDEYSVFGSDLEKERLDQFGKWLQRYSTMNGYIVTYEGQEQKELARATGKRIKDYLMKGFALDPMRLVIIAGGYRDKPTVELFVWPRSWRQY